MTWLTHILGLDNGSGYFYLWWSGIGSDLAEFAVFGSLIAVYRKHTCHVDAPRSCWRPGTYHVEGTPFRACKRHHPMVPVNVSAEHIADAHAEASNP